MTARSVSCLGHLGVGVGVLEVVADVEDVLEPRRVDRVVDALAALGRAGESPVVLETEGDAALGGVRGGGCEGLDRPVVALVGRIALCRRLLAEVVPHVVEVAQGVPAAAVCPDERGAQGLGDIDGRDQLVELDRPALGGELDRVVRRGQGDRGDAAQRRVLVEFVSGRDVVLPVENEVLPEDLDARNAERGTTVDHRFDRWRLLAFGSAAEAMEGVGRDRDLDGHVVQSRAGRPGPRPPGAPQHVVSAPFRDGFADPATGIGRWPRFVTSTDPMPRLELFFVVSGFVIMMTAYGRPIEKFTASRIARLFPA